MVGRVKRNRTSRGVMRPEAERSRESRSSFAQLTDIASELLRRLRPASECSIPSLSEDAHEYIELVKKAAPRSKATMLHNIRNRGRHNTASSLTSWLLQPSRSRWH